MEFPLELKSVLYETSPHLSGQSRWNPVMRWNVGNGPLTGCPQGLQLKETALSEE